LNIFNSSIIELIFRIFFIPNCFPFIYNLIIKFYARIFLFLLGVFCIPYKIRRQKKNPNIIISSQSSLIDWLILVYNYNPKILYIAKSDNNEQDAFIELSYISMLFYGAGIKFNKFNPKKKYFDINKYLKENPNGRPLLIFPEATKSNRLAILSIRSNLMDNIYKMAKENKINIRSEIIINKNYEINTTDTLGLKSLFNLCSYFYTPIEVCSQDIKNENFSEENSDYDKSKYDNFNLYLDSIIQEYLMEPIHRNTVSLNSFDHEKFVEYFRKTNKDSKANYVRSNKSE
jgi:hypothetical protein